MRMPCVHNCVYPWNFETAGVAREIYYNSDIIEYKNRRSDDDKERNDPSGILRPSEPIRVHRIRYLNSDSSSTRYGAIRNLSYRRSKIECSEYLCTCTRASVYIY
jgi:hypothetical protein